MFHVKRQGLSTRAFAVADDPEHHSMFHVKRGGRSTSLALMLGRDLPRATAGRVSHGVHPRTCASGSVTRDRRSDSWRGRNSRRTAAGDMESDADAFVPRSSTGARASQCAVNALRLDVRSASNVEP